MSKAVFFEEFGNVDVLKVGNVKDSDPSPNEVQIRQKAIGVNELDVLYRQGKLLKDEGTKICGSEAVGVIEKIGADVKGFEVGQKVAYATTRAGAYREIRNVNASFLVGVPDEVSFKDVAANLFKGMTGHFLACRTFITKSGTAVLVHNAGSLTGIWISMFARQNGSLVIGTVESEEQKSSASQFCHKVFDISSRDWARQIREYTKNIGVNVVYNLFGDQMIEGSIECLMDIGLLVLNQNLDSKIKEIKLEDIRDKSLYVTYPNLNHYKKSKMELVLSANEIFQALIQGTIEKSTYQEFSLDKAAEAHSMIESKEAKGPIVLIP